jgi:dTDP-4-amino-4,6-dideoxygalactose transaminase
MTIRDMTRIIEAHDLVPVPVDLDMRRLAVRPESIAQAVTTRTRAVLVAHLFGSRMPVEPVLRVARDYGLLVIEDCAQAYAGDNYRGHPQSDVSMFSFGPTKSATALAGGMLRFLDPSLRNQVYRHQCRWPIQNRWCFLARICKYSLLMLLSYPPIYSLFILMCRVFGTNHDQIISDRVRGFPGKDLFTQIRQRPSAALLALLERRLRQFDHAKVGERTTLAQLAITRMPSVKRPGDQALYHTHWVFPILHETPEQLMRNLWTKGFDATRGASSLYIVDPPTDRPEMLPAEAKEAFNRLLYLPVYAGMSRRDIERLAYAVTEFDARQQNDAQE